MLTNATSLPSFLRTGLVVGALTLALTACGGTKWGFPYRADVQQGNWITSEQVSMLREGMSREQVRFLLGTPTLQDVFHADRWDYPYFHKPGYGDEQARRFTVWFEDNVLVRWAGDEQPDRQPFQRTDTGVTPGSASASAAPEAQTGASGSSSQGEEQPEADARAVPSPVIITQPGQMPAEPLR